MRKWYKRWYTIVPLCLVLVFCCVLGFSPKASAVGADGRENLYSVLPFDVIACNNPTFIAEWHYNVTQFQGGSIGWRYDVYEDGSSTGDVLMSGRVNYSDNGIYGAFRLNDTSNFYLYSDMVLFELSESLQALLTWNEEAAGGASITISFEVAEFELFANEKWILQSTPCIYTFVPARPACNLYKTIYDMLIYNGFDDETEYLLTNLKVSFAGGEDGSSFVYTCDCRSTPANSGFDHWVNSHQLTFWNDLYSDLSIFTLGEWLGDVVQSFLDFQIYPGLSLNMVFSVVVVLGVFTFILTLVL